MKDGRKNRSEGGGVLMQGKRCRAVAQRRYGANARICSPTGLQIHPWFDWQRAGHSEGVPPIRGCRVQVTISIEYIKFRNTSLLHDFGSGGKDVW